MEQELFTHVGIGALKQQAQFAMWTRCGAQNLPDLDPLQYGALNSIARLPRPTNPFEIINTHYIIDLETGCTVKSCHRPREASK